MNRSETSHGDGNGYFRGDSFSQAELSSLPSECIIPWERNTGWLAEGFVIFKWYVDANGDGSWLVCDRTDQWYFNSEPASTLRLIGRGAASESVCGAGYYGLGNYAGMKDSNAWYGWDVIMYSGYHLLPDYSLKSTSAPDKAPPGVNEDGLGLPGSLPEKMPVADGNGKPAHDGSGAPVTTQVMPDTPAGAAAKSAASGNRTFTTDENGATTEEIEITLDGLLK
ncbi:hypothetical protein GTY68_00370 [Streptomyces sp. SID4926]|uniref:Uncharacterized protein n=3 Tax=Streptomyces TaxID=1883 RepID=A0ABU2R7R6_9ACTN|nr:hypothetical protein [Streptomyces sp. DSM 41979]MDT0412660.1 hypothetical protein [Streptomyces sp. DSM 41979]MYQ55735.1 hypothetical protein [Streptomyces sp. SID4926]